MEDGDKTKKRILSWLSFGLGGASGNSWKQMASFVLVFFMNVAGLSSSQAGFVRATGQVTCLLSNAIFGYLCDKADVPWLSRRVGRKKSWHLLSSLLTALFLFVSFSRCGACDGSAWAPAVFYVVAYGAGGFFFGAADVSYLSAIPVIAKDQDEAVILNSFRWVNTRKGLRSA